MAKFVQTLFCVLLFLCTVSASSWSSCSSHPYKVKVEDAKVIPDPAVSGNDVEFQIAASTDASISSGKLDISVYLPYIPFPIHTEEHELCDKTSCPVQPGDFLIKSSQNLPGVTPAGSYKVRMDLYDSKRRTLTCAYVNFKIVPPVSDQ